MYLYLSLAKQIAALLVGYFRSVLQRSYTFEIAILPSFIFLELYLTFDQYLYLIHT